MCFSVSKFISLSEHSKKGLFNMRSMQMLYFVGIQLQDRVRIEFMHEN